MVRGGSTITMQLAKNLFLSGSRSYFRKAQELLITYMIEAVMSKERILEIYLNVAEWGVGVFGCEAGARHYFNVSAAQLGAAQAARMAAMLPRPRFYDVNRSSRYLSRRAGMIMRGMGRSRHHSPVHVQFIRNLKMDGATQKDYASFASVAKSRFGKIARELGYEQVTGILYVRPREGWYELFCLQASSHGNPFFYFNYGVICPEQFPLTREQLKSHGWVLDRRLYGESSAFSCATKADVDASAAAAFTAFKEQAVPWFNSLSLEVIRREIGR